MYNNKNDNNTEVEHSDRRYVRDVQNGEETQHSGVKLLNTGHVNEQAHTRTKLSV